MKFARLQDQDNYLAQDALAELYDAQLQSARNRENN